MCIRDRDCTEKCSAAEKIFYVMLSTNSVGFKQKTAYEIASGDWSSDVCSSDLNQVAYDDYIDEDVKKNEFIFPSDEYLDKCYVFSNVSDEVYSYMQEPVSYTHLDVYKRQRMYRGFLPRELHLTLQHLICISHW